MGSLRTAANVYNTCLVILRERGYTLSLKRNITTLSSEEAVSMWIAEKNGFQFNADNPIELLGLTTIYEYKMPVVESKPNWWYVEGPDIYTELIDNVKLFEEGDS